MSFLSDLFPIQSVLIIGVSSGFLKWGGGEIGILETKRLRRPCYVVVNIFYFH